MSSWDEACGRGVEDHLAPSGGDGYRTFFSVPARSVRAAAAPAPAPALSSAPAPAPAPAAPHRPWFGARHEALRSRILSSATFPDDRISYYAPYVHSPYYSPLQPFLAAPSYFDPFSVPVRPLLAPAVSVSVPLFNGSVYSDTCAIESQRAQMECSPGLETTRACGVARATRDAVCGGRMACGISTNEYPFVVRLGSPLHSGYALTVKTIQPCTGVHSSSVYVDFGKDVHLRVRDGAWLSLELSTSSDRVLETTTIDPFSDTCVAGSCMLSSVQRYLSVGRSVSERNVFVVMVHAR
jgi:hypothetical protein